MEHKDFIKVGRGHDSEVRITDISVSRCHALIKKSIKGDFVVEDNNSKFGTIVLVKGQLPLVQENTYAVQVGRTVISYTVRNVDVSKNHKDNGIGPKQGALGGKKEVRPMLHKALSSDKNGEVEQRFLR